jgi:hypothetical protein
MNHSSAPAFAQRRARILLAAWNSGNLARLEAALNDNGGDNWDCSDVRLPAIERERIELIGEVVQSIRGWIAKARTQTELQAALLLLRHLGGQEPLHFSAAATRNQDMALAGSRSI